MPESKVEKNKDIKWNLCPIGKDCSDSLEEGKDNFQKLHNILEEVQESDKEQNNFLKQHMIEETSHHATTNTTLGWIVKLGGIITAAMVTYGIFVFSQIQQQNQSFHRINLQYMKDMTTLSMSNIKTKEDMKRIENLLNRNWGYIKAISEKKK